MAVAATQPDVRADTRTVASMARAWAQQSPHQVALREKDLGIWRERTWRQVWDDVLAAAHGLLALGVEPGDRVSIHAEDRPEWVILDLATVAIRGVTVGLYPTNPTPEVRYTLGDCGSVVHLAEDQEQLDKVLEIAHHDLPALRQLVSVEPRGLATVQDDRLISWETLLDRGREHQRVFPDAVDRRMSEAQPDDVMTLVYTSGTTGPPKGAMLTHANVAFSIDTIVRSPQRLPRGPGPDDQILTYLPLCHVAERLFSTWNLVSSGTVLNFAESIESVTENLREVQPTLFFAVPRIWEKLHAGVMIRGQDASWLKRRVFRLGLRLADRIGDDKVRNGGEHTARSRLLSAVGFPLVLRPLRERIGLRHCRWAGSGAAPIAPEVLKFFMGLGIPVYELYGMTENTAVATCNFVGRMKLGTVGEVYPGTELRLDEKTKEIQTRHPGNFAGYWGKPDATREIMTEDGWLRTGDVGEWVEGTHLRIVDRIKHIIITSGGKNISPSEIENDLKSSPYVREAMVIGDRRNYLTALIGIEYDTVGNWALRSGLTFTTYRDLSEKPEVVDLIRGEVERTSEKFARVESIRRFRLLPKELDHEDGELTATQKIKRTAMESRFADLIEDMYR